MKTYIIFDTNILYTRNHRDFSLFEFNSIYDEVQGKIERNNVIDIFELRVPNITVQELFKQQLQAYNSEIEKIQDSYLKFKQIYEIDLKMQEQFDYEAFLEKKKEEYILRKGINIISICKAEKFSRIVDRALNKQAPFEGKDKQSDKGFKDALIWESILEFAEENDGEYIFFTTDKGFKEELKIEFNGITGKNIEIYGRDDKKNLDVVIEKYSAEKSMRVRSETINENLEGHLEMLISELEYKAFQKVELNGIVCAVNDFEIVPQIIDLNEVGDKTFKFKLKGKMKAGKTGISYELKTSLYFLVEIDNLKSSKVQLIKLDNIDATSMEDDLINIADISFVFSPEEVEEEEEEVEEVEEVEVEEEEEVEVEVEVEEKEKVEEEVEGISTVKESVESMIAGTEFEGDINSQRELIDIIKKNYTVDWIAFESKKAQMRLVIKNYLRMKHLSNERIEIITDLILEKLIANFPKEIVVE
ncbi:PIN domain-containing protein [Bacillus paranthracis]|uniref:PIN domain-containing protein n=1 Tax=Bacillus paranthracis TaxID=2026186 RepID=UPI0013D820B9|nr:PIN domain-containing protein [Bacillus paranthracis]MCU5298395.1 PIN domain-containing protein [Bacillus paranthracis]